LAVPDLPAVVIPGTFAPVVKCLPRSPSTAATIAVVIACALVVEITRPIDFGPIVRVPLAFPVIAVTSRGCISSPSFATVDGTSMLPTFQRSDLVALRTTDTYRVGDVAGYYHYASVRQGDEVVEVAAHCARGPVER
jgi:hypothetical protein